MNTREPLLRASICAQIHHDRRVVAGRLAFPFLPDDLRVSDPVGQRGGGEDEVDAHSLSLREPQLGVVPIGVNPGAGGERPYYIRELSVDDSIESLALRFGDMCGAVEELDAPDVIVGWGDVPVPD